MTEAESQFRAWFVESLKPLRADGNAGFIFVLTAFPLLERYMRRKAGCPDGQALTTDFFTNVGTMFGVDGKKFWDCYRNGLLHQMSFATAKLNNAGIWVDLPQSGLSGHDPRPVYFNAETNQFFLNPKAFFDAVTAAVLADFSTYEGGQTPHYRLPGVVSLPTAVSGVVPTIGPNVRLTDGTGSYGP